MRNLKRALSLTLASVMLLGMMVVGSSALSFNDADDISNVTAATVLQELGVMIGNDGNFMPEAPVSRAQMAILICRMLYGDKLNVSQFSGTTQYTDVPAYEYYNGYVNLATSLGIINGYGDGRFGPDDTVTTAQAALMLCRALGYFKGGEMTGNWGSDALAAIAQATKINMFGDLKLATNDLLSRDNVAEMVFNSMTKAVPVEYSERWGMYYNDSQSIMSGVTFKYTDTLGYNNFDLVYDEGETDDAGHPSTVWGLGRIPSGVNGASSLDEKGNIPNGVAVIRTEILKAPNKTVAIFTVGTSADDVAKALKGYKVWLDVNGDGNKDTADGFVSIENSTTQTAGGKLYANGDTTGTDKAILINNGGAKAAITLAAETIAKAIADETANGKLVEVFVNSSNQVTDIVTTAYTVAKVTGISSNKDRTSYSFDVSALNGIDYVDEAVDDTIAISGSIAKDDIVTGVKIKGKTYVYPTTSFTGIQGSFNTGKKTVTIDGKTYDVAVGMTKSGGTVAMGDFANSKNEATYFVDQYGCLVKTDAIESTDFVVIDAIRWDTNSMEGAAQAKLIFADGTTKEVTLNSLDIGVAKKGFQGEGTDSNIALATASANHKIHNTASKNGIFQGIIATYSVRDDGKYDLTLKNTAINGNNKETSTAADPVTEKGVPALQDSTKAYISAISGNSKTIYIVKTGTGSDTKYNAYTGYQNVPSIDMGTGHSATISYVRDGNSGTLAKYIFIDATAGAGTNTAPSIGDSKGGDIVYIFDATNYDDDGTGNDRYIYHNVVLNDADGQDVIADKAATFGSAGFYEVDRNSKGVVTGITAVSSRAYTAYNVAASAANNVLNVSKVSDASAAAFSYDGSEQVWVIDPDAKTVRTGNAEDAMKGTTSADVVYIKAKGSSSPDNTTIEKMYVIKDAAVVPASTSITLAKGGSNPVDTIGEADVMSGNAAASGWVTSTKDKIKITVVDAAGTTSTIKINNAAYTSGNDYTVAAAGNLTVEVTITQTATGLTAVNTYTVSVTA